MVIKFDENVSRVQSYVRFGTERVVSIPKDINEKARPLDSARFSFKFHQFTDKPFVFAAHYVRTTSLRKRNRARYILLRNFPHYRNRSYNYFTRRGINLTWNIDEAARSMHRINGRKYYLAFPRVRAARGRVIEFSRSRKETKRSVLIAS